MTQMDSTTILRIILRFSSIATNVHPYERMMATYFRFSYGLQLTRNGVITRIIYPISSESIVMSACIALKQRTGTILWHDHVGHFTLLIELYML